MPGNLLDRSYLIVNPSVRPCLCVFGWQMIAANAERQLMWCLKLEHEKNEHGDVGDFNTVF